MVILEFILLSLVLGTLLGVGWRIVDEAWEKHKATNKPE
jgi:hypothetical protein